MFCDPHRLDCGSVVREALALPAMEMHVGQISCGGCGERSCPHCAGKAEKGWSKGLRQLYDSVLSEPLPDSFAELLKKLEKAGHD